jgi:uncharacterized protein
MIDNSFWNQRVQVTQAATLPAMYSQMKQTGRWDAMRLTWKKGDENEPHIFWDSDIAKVVESACYALRGLEDPELSKQFKSWIDDAVDMIKKAQQPDGYINIHFTVVEPENRWKDVAHMHELYCAGHLLEAAIAHHEVTKSNEFLDVMCRYIDYICTVFGPGKNQLHGYPGHPEIELALVRLLSIRNEPRYLSLLKFFVDERGKNGGEFYSQEAKNLGIDPMNFVPGKFNTGKPWPDAPCFWYMQAEAPIRELTEIKGHSVRAMYLLAGVEGLANFTKDSTLNDAVDRLWRNMIDTKFYIHGGIGAVHQWEGFAPEHDLPLDCYAETCASLAILFLSKQILNRKLDGEIPRVMERALYNDAIGGVSLDGKSFYYDQPLVGRGMKRSSWFEVSCCPPNLARVLNSLDFYAYTERDDIFAINMWMGGKHHSKDVSATITSDYPSRGNIEIDLVTERELEFALYLPDTQYISNIEGKVVDGYLRFTPRKWNTKISVSYDIKPKIVHPSSKVSSTKGMVAIERGPFVYGVEQSGSSIPLNQISLSESSKFSEELVTVEGTTFVALNLQSEDNEKVQFVPYFVLGNRVPGEDFRVYVNEQSD